MKKFDAVNYFLTNLLDFKLSLKPMYIFDKRPMYIFDKSSVVHTS